MRLIKERHTFGGLLLRSQVPTTAVKTIHKNTLYTPYKTRNVIVQFSLKEFNKKTRTTNGAFYINPLRFDLKRHSHANRVLFPIQKRNFVMEKT